MNNLIKKISASIILLFLTLGTTYPRQARAEENVSPPKRKELVSSTLCKGFAEVVKVFKPIGKEAQEQFDKLVEREQREEQLKEVGEKVVEGAVEKGVGDKIIQKFKKTVKIDVSLPVDLPIGGGRVPVDAPGVEQKIDESMRELRDTITDDLKKQQELEKRNDCETFLKKVLLVPLKKRILDEMVNQTVGWIQGGGEPLFIKDTGAFLRDASNAAVGDVVEEVGLARICDPFKFRVRFQLEQREFVHEVSCTLDQIVQNFQDFYDDFRTGGWIGYQRLLEPQNNRLGTGILVESRLQQKKSEKKEAAALEAAAGQKFKDQKICLRWEKQVKLGVPGKVLPESGRAYYNKSPDGKDYTGATEQPAQSKWRCALSQTITPGRTVGDAAAKAVGAQYDFIINADDLSKYADALSDALINRLTTEAGVGFLNVFKGVFEKDKEGKAKIVSPPLSKVDFRKTGEKTTKGEDEEEIDKYLDTIEVVEDGVKRPPNEKERAEIKEELKKTHGPSAELQKEADKYIEGISDRYVKERDANKTLKAQSEADEAEEKRLLAQAAAATPATTPQAQPAKEVLPKDPREAARVKFGTAVKELEAARDANKKLIEVIRHKVGEAPITSLLDCQETALIQGKEVKEFFDPEATQKLEIADARDAPAHSISKKGIRKKIAEISELKDKVIALDDPTTNEKARVAAESSLKTARDEESNAKALNKEIQAQLKKAEEDLEKCKAELAKPK